MRIYFPSLIGVWLLAAPLLFAQSSRKMMDELLEFKLDETPEQVARRLGNPAQVVDAGVHHLAWHYRTDVEDNHDLSHLIVFSKRDRRVVSVTRNLNAAVRLDSLIGSPEKAVRYHWPERGNPLLTVRVVQLTANRLLLAVGEDEKTHETQQLLMIRRTALRQFLPWLDARLAVESDTHTDGCRACVR